MADNATLLRSLYDAWNDRDFDVVVDAAAPDFKLVVAGTGDVYEGPEGARRYNESWADGFPDGRITVDNLVDGGDCIVAEFTGRGTHTATFVTSMGSIPATGRSVTVKICDVVEFRDGKITNQRSYFDSGSLMAQLGLADEKAATTR
jgi:steroid delta-isomerase-like uncharacterized protein